MTTIYDFCIGDGTAVVVTATKTRYQVWKPCKDGGHVKVYSDRRYHRAVSHGRTLRDTVALERGRA